MPWTKSSDVKWSAHGFQKECCKFFSVSVKNFHVKSETLKKNIFQKVRQNGPSSFLLFFFKGPHEKNLMLFSNRLKENLQIMLTSCVSILETRFFEIFQNWFTSYIYPHENFVYDSFKKDTDVKKRAH